MNHQKPEACRHFFNSAQGCKMGDDCRYSHIQLESTSVAEKGEGSQQRNNSNASGKQEKSNRKRARERDIVKMDDKICPSINVGKECKYGDKCYFTHDIAAFLARKPKDIGTRCVQYDIYRECPNGLSCLFKIIP